MSCSLWHEDRTCGKCLRFEQEGQAGRLWSQGFNTEEVNSIDISPCGRLLVSADDAGQVAVINLEEGTLVQRLIKGHTNIASSAVFQGQNSWQVVSGGLDCQILCWDFSGDTVLQRWDLGTTSALAWSILISVFGAPKSSSQLIIVA